MIEMNALWQRKLEVDRAWFIYTESAIEFCRAYWEKRAEAGQLFGHSCACKSLWQALHDSYLATMQSIDPEQSEDDDSNRQIRLMELTDALSAVDRAANKYASAAAENFGLISRYYLDEPSSREWGQEKVGRFVEIEMTLPMLYEQFDQQRTRYQELFEAFKRDYLDGASGTVV
jgi:hypothetical protein